MYTILYMTTSIDGKTTRDADNVDWVEVTDIERMDTLMKECGVMMMGSKTYESFGEDLPNDQALQVVLTSNPDYLKLSLENVIFTKGKPREVLEKLDGDGFAKVLLAGGSTLNTSMMNEDLIDEIRLIVKPLVIGKGKPLFNDASEIYKFELRDVIKLKGNSVELRYTRKL